MGITLGGVPLLMDTAELQDWCGNYLPFVRDFIHAPTIARSPLRNDPLGARKFPIVSGPNYAPAPNLRFNELYWPTGASRWAEAYFLTTGEYAGQITSQIASGGSAYLPVPVVMNDGEMCMQVEMYALPPRPLSAITLTNPAFVIPMVDERYFWQGLDGGIDDVVGTTWLTMIRGLRPASSHTLSFSEISAAYAIPETACFTRRSSVPELIDAACHSVGTRFVRKFDMNYKVEGWTDARTVYEANRTVRGELLAGDDFSGALPQAVYPSSVDTYFPALNVDCDMEKKSFIPQVRGKNGRAKSITTFAPFADNDTVCQQLATKIGEDYAESLRFRYDLAFCGIQPWEPSAYDDGIIFSFACLGGQKHGAQVYRATTRAWSAPYNFGVEEMYHAFEALPTFIGEDHLTGTLDAELTYGGSATVSVLEGNPGDLSDSGKNVKAFDELMVSGQTIASGGRVHLTRKCGYWAVTGAACDSEGGG